MSETRPNLLENAVVLDLTFHVPGCSRKGNLAEVQTDADKSLLGLSKRIFAMAAYRRACHIRNDCRSWIERFALPSPLKAGSYLVPIALLEQVYRHVDEAEAEFNAAADEAAEEYPQAIEDARAALRSQFDQRNYPGVERFRAGFWLERRLLDFGLPSANKVGEVLFRQERERAEEQWRNATEEVKAALRQSMLDLVRHLAERLEPGPDGKRKIFKNTAVLKLTEFLDVFDARNLANDQDLQAVVQQARAVLDGRTPDSIRGSDGTRREIKATLDQVGVQLDALLADAPARAISFED